MIKPVISSYALAPDVTKARSNQPFANTSAPLRVQSEQPASPAMGSRTPTVLERRGDLNGDGRVDQSDLGLVLAAHRNGTASDADVAVVRGYWGHDVSGLQGVPLANRDYGDLDGNGLVDQADLGLLLANMGRLDRRALALADVNRDGVIDESDGEILRGFYGMRV